jgi:deazaflavin-dependent oxidoreductase (nitroreductase family)
MLRVLLIAAAVFVIFWFVVVPVFERFAPAHVVRAYQRLTMPFFRVTAGYAPGFGVVETIGRRTGKPRRVPVGGRLSDDTFWFVAGIGRRAHYMKNIEANPRVRVKVNGRWRSGTAYFCPEDDARKRMFRVSPINGLFLWVAGGEGLSVRIELDG